MLLRSLLTTHESLKELLFLACLLLDVAVLKPDIAEKRAAGGLILNIKFPIVKYPTLKKKKKEKKSWSIQKLWRALEFKILCSKLI